MNSTFIHSLIRPTLSTLMLAAILGSSGCAYNSIFINYPAQIAPIKQELNTATPMADIEKLASNIQGNDGLLYAQEAGRVAQVAGDFASSRKYYQQAVEAYTAFDDKAKISASDIGATATSLVLNDNAIPYRGPGYERIMLHQYQALNYLFSGDYQGALVEVRRSNELQSSEQERYQKSQKSVQAMANGTIDAEMNKLGQAAGTVTSSFLNAYSYYTTGLLHEVLGEPNDAFIDYRKAAQISPDNTYLQQDLVRLAKQLGMPQYDEFKKRWGDAKFPKAGEGQVILMVEKGFVPEKQALTVPFTIHGNWQTVSLATYGPNNSVVAETQVQGLGTVLKTEPIANIDALAINALKEDLPGTLVRQVARVYAKSEMAYQVEKSGKPGNNAADIGSIAMQIFNVVSEQADRRSWLTLPKQAQIGRRYLNPGEYTLQLDKAPPAKIEVAAGKTTLVWAIDTGNYTRIYSIII
ncbi:COG3014 family protein [Shewanella sp. Koi 1]